VIPEAIYIYPKTFEKKGEILEYLDAWNVGKEESEQIEYIDVAEIALSFLGKLVDIISYVLIAFSAISLVVSSVMISITTYVSVIERTKEIGVLRSLGARKKDISRVFNTETLMIGFAAGTIGVTVNFIATLIVNAVIAKLADIQNLASLKLTTALIMIAISMVLTLIAGLIPARIAAKKDPVTALRTE
jgi:putative ABC transport system permease protein